ncbi:hypothetical protein UCRPA7_2615 [Phaeoacremonium minimum UCRPA7]|uniref:Uncharacterized protein n=1 Tax=Phaeoacremonium minimum (strain UCR-PA7) TaxID=1286976 RepID=R8BRB5_PHAM7|nr:hypothetical protein UCRPA7_2615 [Phaeoacremonium minimum UCRPA7]EOO01876.1 hypothetical protein UCRPA7_2615 [Phaeoacremonium minimum UCRPA7]
MVPVVALATQKVLPATVFLGAAGGVAAYVRSQLRTESNTMDRFFAQYKSPQSELSRQRVFEGAQEDPRKSLFNVLGW